MSAIAGTLSFDGQGNPEDTRQILAASARFGGGSPTLTTVGPACLGVDRFAALAEDETGEEPSEIGPVIVVADIRLDNRPALLRDLGVPPSLTDQQLAAHAWRQWGAECLPRLLGDFALAVFDRRDGALHLARDTRGERPLFVRRRHGGVAFASMPLGLVALDEAPPFDLLALAAALCDRSIKGHSSYFESIERVLPGEHWRIGTGAIARSRYWAPDFTPLRLPSQREYVDAFREQLDRSVAVRLRRRGGRLASFLSAGFDSSAVTATAARLAGAGEVMAFTHAPAVGFQNELPKGTIGDESDIASLTAASLGIDHHVVRGAGDPFAHLKAQAETYQDPYRNVLNSGWEADIDRIARARGCRVMLTGEFGNLTLHAGGAAMLADHVRQGRWLRWLCEAWAIRTNPDISMRGMLYNSFGEWLPPSADRWLRRRFLSIDAIDVGFLTPKWAARVAEGLQDGVGGFEGDAMRRWITLSETDPAVVRKGILAESGIDTRDPLNDRDLIQFSLRLPIEQMFRDGHAWPLARAALADRLPGQVLQKRLRGYQSVDWRSRFDSSAVMTMIDDIERSETARELIDFDKLRQAAGTAPDRHLARADTIARYTGRLPGTIAMGYFLLAAERAGCSPAA